MRESSSDREPRPEPQPDASPRFGRLLVVLALAVLVIVAVTFLSEAYLA